MDEETRRPAEPEIIPPGVPLPGGSRVWVSTGAEGTQRIYIKRVGPLGMAVAALAVGVIAAIGLIVVVGFAVIALIAAGLLAAAFIVAGLLRKPNQPLR
jgi:hypothetical protein